MDEVLRVVRRYMRLEICAVYKINWHETPDDHKFNTIDVIMRDRALKGSKSPIRKQLPVLQNFLGGHCGGYNWNPRVGDLVWVFFYGGRQGLILANAWSWAELPACRPGPYDIADKNGQWQKPEQDSDGDFTVQPYPELKKPYCDRWFHGKVTGSCGKGRDHKIVHDYCQEGDGTPNCSKCKTIDSIGRCKNWWDAYYSWETESCQAPPKRDEKHVPCGSYLRIESETGQSEEYSEGCGHIRLGNATCEAQKKGHINWKGNKDGGAGTLDIHAAHEEVAFASESIGARISVVHNEDSSVTFAVESIYFDQNAYIRIMKDGQIRISTPKKVTIESTSADVLIQAATQIELKAPLVLATTNLFHDTGDETVSGHCEGPNNNL